MFLPCCISQVRLVLRAIVLVSLLFGCKSTDKAKNHFAIDNLLVVKPPIKKPQLVSNQFDRASFNSYLVAAIENKNLDFIRETVKKNGIEKISHINWLPILHFSFYNDCYQCIELLLEFGANPLLKSRSGETLYDLAIHDKKLSEILNSN